MLNIKLWTFWGIVWYLYFSLSPSRGQRDSRLSHWQCPPTYTYCCKFRIGIWCWLSLRQELAGPWWTECTRKWTPSGLGTRGANKKYQCPRAEWTLLPFICSPLETECGISFEFWVLIINIWSTLLIVLLEVTSWKNMSMSENLWSHENRNLN